MFSATNGHQVLRYSGLTATDARGRTLPSQLTLDGDRLQLHVNDHGAHYPITVDPLIQVATISATEAGMSSFGFRVAVSGTTMVVGDGDPGGTPATTGTAGAAFVFTRVRRQLVDDDHARGRADRAERRLPRGVGGRVGEHRLRRRL